jgi:hypothetical protein
MSANRAALPLGEKGPRVVGGGALAVRALALSFAGDVSARVRVEVAGAELAAAGAARLVPGALAGAAVAIAGTDARRDGTLVVGAAAAALAGP